jgi:hypothetical protein
MFRGTTMDTQHELEAIHARMAERVTFMSSVKIPVESKLWMMGAQKRDWQRVKALRTQLEVRHVAPTNS